MAPSGKNRRTRASRLLAESPVGNHRSCEDRPHTQPSARIHPLLCGSIPCDLTATTTKAFEIAQRQGARPSSFIPNR